MLPARIGIQFGYVRKLVELARERGRFAPYLPREFFQPSDPVVLDPGERQRLDLPVAPCRVPGADTVKAMSWSSVMPSSA